jgi:hypothetical protein
MDFDDVTLELADGNTCSVPSEQPPAAYSSGANAN